MDEILNHIDIYKHYAIIYYQFGRLFSAKAFSIYRTPMIINGIGYFQDQSEAGKNMEAAIDVMSKEPDTNNYDEKDFELFVSIVKEVLRLKAGESLLLSRNAELNNLIDYDFEDSSLFQLLQNFADEMGFEIEQARSGDYYLTKIEYFGKV